MKVVILMGGNSKERQVSLQSGNAIFRACKQIGYDTSIIDMTDHIDYYFYKILIKMQNAKTNANPMPF